MTTTIPSGLGLTLGCAQETTVGIAATVSRWLPIDPNEGFSHKNTVLQGKALYGQLFLLGKHRVVPTVEAVGKFSMDVTDKQMGILFQAMMGGTSSIAAPSSGHCLQIHTPATVQGKSITFQKAVPETPSGTIVPETYVGSKITEWTLSCKRNEQLKLDVTLDSILMAGSGTVAYVAASFVQANVFNFGNGSMTIGGTVTGDFPTITISGGAAPSGIVSGISIKGTRKLNTKRFNFGSNVKQEQLENDFLSITGELEIEFANVNDWYNDWINTTQVPLSFTWTSPADADAFVTFLISNAAFEDSPPLVTSPDVIVAKVPFTVLSDGTNLPAQLVYNSVDSSI